MDLNNVINNIENIDNLPDRCIAYAEVILHLRMVRESLIFRRDTPEWKNEINDMLTNDSKADIDKQIEHLKNMIDLNVKVNKL